MGVHELASDSQRTRGIDRSYLISAYFATIGNIESVQFVEPVWNGLSVPSEWEILRIVNYFIVIVFGIAGAGKREETMMIRCKMRRREVRGMRYEA